MRFVVLIVSLMLAVVGFVLDGNLFPQSEATPLTIIFFLMPSVFCIGHMYEKFLDGDEKKKE